MVMTLFVRLARLLTFPHRSETFNDKFPLVMRGDFVYTWKVIKEVILSYIVTGPIASVHVSDRVIQIWSDDQLREVCDYFDSIGVSYDLVIV
jgi:hypothetical protein